ncbi:MAG: CsiV family protein [Pseudomonadota bacterium]
MSRPRNRPLLRLLCACAGAVSAATAAAQTLPEDAMEDWYRVELLVFLREDAQSLGAEQWPALPVLSYAESLRYLVDPQLADRRLLESSALQSRIDELGVQSLLLPAPFSILDEASRPDALIGEPWVDPQASLPDPNSPDYAPEGGTSAVDGASAAVVSGAEAEPDAVDAPPQLPLVMPYQLVDQSALDFTAQARGLRRRGERVVFHEGWWARLRVDEPQNWIALDRGADMDTRDWPEIQGGVHIYRSRYLHIDVDLWLNTRAPYLPEGWQIDAPPLPPVSLRSGSLDGAAINPWKPDVYAPALGAVTEAPIPGAPAGPGLLSRRPGPGMDEGSSRPGAAAPVSPELSLAVPGIEAQDVPAYPWRHAIVHEQSRRMRSQETHYLDHPVIGVIVRVTPASEDLQPVADEEDLEFRERHGLPVTRVEVKDDQGDAAP